MGKNTPLQLRQINRAMPTEKILTRDFIYSFLAQFTFASAFLILLPTLPIYLSRLKLEEEEIGILIGVFSISSVVLRPFVGKALLRIPERDFMMAGSLLGVLTSLSCLFAYPFWPFFIVRIFQGIAWASFFTASFTLIANITPEAHRGQSITYFYLSLNLAFVVAPSLGMFLINLFSFTLLFLMCAGLCLCALLLSLRLQKRQVYSLEDPSISKGSFINREALPAAMTASLSNVAWGGFVAFFPLYSLANGVDNPGLFFTVFAIILILGRVFAGKMVDTTSREKVILPCLINYIVSMVILAFSTTLPMFILIAVIWGIGNVFLFPALIADSLDRAGPSRGPAMGTFTALADLGTGLGSVIMGVVLQLTNYSFMFLGLALIGVINLFYYYFFVREKG